VQVPDPRDGVEQGRAQAEPLESLRPRIEAMTAESAKQLLRPVSDEQSAHHKPQQQSSDLQLCTSVPAGVWVRSMCLCSQSSRSATCQSLLLSSVVW
jgi:hypothetical protein